MYLKELNPFCQAYQWLFQVKLFVSQTMEDRWLLQESMDALWLVYSLTHTLTLKKIPQRKKSSIRPWKRFKIREIWSPQNRQLQQKRTRRSRNRQTFEKLGWTLSRKTCRKRTVNIKSSSLIKTITIRSKSRIAWKKCERRRLKPSAYKKKVFFAPKNWIRTWWPFGRSAIRKSPTLSANVKSMKKSFEDAKRKKEKQFCKRNALNSSCSSLRSTHILCPKS